MTELQSIPTPTGDQIQQIARDNSVQIGQVFGSIYNHYAAADSIAQGSNESVDVNALLRSLERQLEHWDTIYTQLWPNQHLI
jgi:hypothetical protein